MLWVALGCSGLRLGCCKNTVFFTCWVALGCSGLLWVAGCNPAATQSNPSATQLGCTGLHTPASCQKKSKNIMLWVALGCSGLQLGCYSLKTLCFTATQLQPRATQVQPKCNPSVMFFTVFQGVQPRCNPVQPSWVALGLHLGCTWVALGCSWVFPPNCA